MGSKGPSHRIFGKTCLSTLGAQSDHFHRAKATKMGDFIGEPFERGLAAFLDCRRLAAAYNEVVLSCVVWGCHFRQLWLVLISIHASGHPWKVRNIHSSGNVFLMKDEGDCVLTYELKWNSRLVHFGKLDWIRLGEPALCLAGSLIIEGARARGLLLHRVCCLTLETVQERAPEEPLRIRFCWLNQVTVSVQVYLVQVNQSLLAKYLPTFFVRPHLRVKTVQYSSCWTRTQSFVSDFLTFDKKQTLLIHCSFKLFT